MGCSASKLDSLPAVSLCHHRFHLIDESLRHSYSFADSHRAYLNSLRSFPAALLSFLRHNTAALSTTSSSADSPPDCISNGKSSSSSSGHDFSSSSSDSLSDDEDHKAEFRNNSYDFHHTKYDSYPEGGGDLRYSWKTPSPPQPRASSAWDFLNFFDTIPFERYEISEKEKERESKERVEAKSGANLPIEKKIDVQEKKEKKCKNREAKDSCPKHVNPAEEKVEEKKETEAEALAKLIKEMEISFENAAESGNQALTSLGAEKSPGVPDEPSVAPPPSADGVDSGACSLDLSSTLSKLCMWEKKLYDEVKAEEKLRMAYERCCRKIPKGLGDSDKATEATLDRAVQATLKRLATQIQVGIQVIDRTATNINTLRDEELFPQIAHLIHKMFEMWKSMLESHRALFKAVSEAQSRNLLALSNSKLSDAGLEFAIQLKIELQSFAMSFNSWVSFQKSCVKSLNGWLLKCLLPDKPAEKQLLGRAEYPPVFALCDKWSNTLDAISETEVLNALQVLLAALNKVLEQQHGHLQELMTADKEMEKKIKGLEKEEQRLKKLVQGYGIGKPFDRKSVNHDEFELGLKQVFNALEKFSASNFEAYEKLHAQIAAAKKPPEGSSSS